jgi:regulator of cell morphogenesis and NO signaling
MMMLEQTGELLAALRTVTDAYRTPEDGCASYCALYDRFVRLEADTHLHSHEENDVLVPAATGGTGE